MSRRPIPHVRRLAPCVGLACLALGALPAAAGSWPDRGQLRSAPAARWLPRAMPQEALVVDPAGDTFGVGQMRLDLDRYEARVDGEELVLDLTFHTDISPANSGQPNALNGFIELDTDQDSGTGEFSFAGVLATTTTGLGVEFFVDLLKGDPAGGTLDVFDDRTDEVVGQASATFGAREVQIRVPLTLIGDPDGLVNTAALVGTLAEPNDIAPNFGSAPSDDETLLLTDGRFRVSVDWRDFADNTGAGKVVPFQTGDSGLFYFFGADNWELLVKVLDTCSFSNRFWVFFAATTNVEFTLRVEDVESGAVKTYDNPLGKSADAITDTDAFATCP